MTRRKASIRDLRAVATLLEPTRGNLYRYVSDEARPVSRDDAAVALHLSRSMAAFHLDKLVESGLLRASYRRLSGRTGRGAGRPAKLYQRSRRRFDVLIPHREHELLARLLAESMSDGGDDELRAQTVGWTLGRSLGARARHRMAAAPSTEHLHRCLEDVMAGLGFEPMRTRPGETRAHNCPFDPLSRQMPSVVCRIAIALLDGVVEGIVAGGFHVSRDERPLWCCVVVASPGRGGNRRSPKTATCMS